MQRDGVATGSPLSPVNAGIFVIELEKKILPKVLQCMTAWKQYVDGTIAYIKPGSGDYVLSFLNSFHSNTNFLYEEE